MNGWDKASTRPTQSWRVWVGLSLWLMVPPVVSAQNAPNSCLDCHQQLDPPLQVTPESWMGSIHQQKGLSCISCHGGDPSSTDPAEAMSPARGFRGHLSRRDIPKLCADCHSRAEYMRRFNPSLRTDQYAQYLTSTHGKLLEHGDQRVAVCTDCHGVHDIRAPTDPRSPVYPLNVARTCARCHADAAYMKPYHIPTDQFASYTASVHYQQLVNAGDLSAPTCVTCHGSHGAVPPGVASVVNVCSTCHVFQAQLFERSPHRAAFEQMQLPGCVTCHGNHRIVHPTDTFVGTGSESVCVRCHAPGDPGYNAAATIAAHLSQLVTDIDRSAQLLNQAARSGVEVSEAQLELGQARDALMKARVAVHSFDVTTVDQNIQAGLEITRRTYRAGLDALAELRYRRRGLAVSLVTIACVLAGLWLWIRRSRSLSHAKED